MKISCAAILVLVTALTSAPVLADTQAATTARQLYKDKSDSLVWVLAVVKLTVSAGSETAPVQEQKMEALGTVIDASGMIVTSYSSLDPSAAIRGKRTADGRRLTAKAEFAEVKVRLADGTELPARVVMKDTDLDLAFIMPDTKSEEAEGVEFTHVGLGDGVSLKVVDETISLSRLSKSLDRRPAVSIGRVLAVVKKPRKVYLIGKVSPGAPVFSVDGNILGLCVFWMVDQRPTSLIVLTAKDVKEIADQAIASAKKKLEADEASKADDDKEAAPKDEATSQAAE